MDGKLVYFRPLVYVLIIAIIVLALRLEIGKPVPTYGGTPSDNYTIERYYSEAVSEQTTALTTYQTAVTCNFTPPATKDYVVIASALTNNSNTAYSTIIHLNVNGTGYSETYHPPVNASANWRSFSTQKLLSATGGDPQTITVEYKSENVAGTASVQRVSISVIEVQTYYNAEQNAESTTTSTSYIDKTTLTFTPTAGDYLLFSTANSKNDTSGKEAFIELSIDAVPDQELQTGNSPYASWSSNNKITLTAASHTIKISYKTDSAGTAYIKDARILVVKLSDLGTAYSVESVAESSTVSTTYVDKATLSFTPTDRKDYFIICDGLGKQEANGYQFWANLSVNGTSYGEYIFETPLRTVYRAFQFQNKLNLPAVTNNLIIQYRTNSSSSSREAFIKHAHIIAIEANTAESYTTGSHTTVGNTYSGTDTAYIWGHGMQASHSYNIAYYDATVTGGGDLMFSENVTSTAYGNLSSQYLLSTVSSTSGTWHAVIFDTAYYSATPTTYDTALTNTGYLVEDSYTVTAPPDISNSPATYNFGVLSESSSTETSLTHFTITNNSAFSITISISGTDMTGGTTWVLSDTATPGSDILGMIAGLEGGSYNVIIKKNPPFNVLKSGLGTGSTQRWGLQFLAPTVFSDGGTKSGTIVLTATQS